MVITSTVALNTREPRQGHTSISSRPCNSYSPRQVTQPIAKTYHIAAERRRPTSTSKTFGSKAFGTSIDVTRRGEFHGSCIDPARNGEASYADPNGAIDAAV